MPLDNKELKQIVSAISASLAPQIREAVAENIATRTAAMQLAVERLIDESVQKTRDELQGELTKVAATLQAAIATDSKRAADALAEENKVGKERFETLSKRITDLAVDGSKANEYIVEQIDNLSQRQTDAAVAILSDFVKVADRIKPIELSMEGVSLKSDLSQWQRSFDARLGDLAASLEVKTASLTQGFGQFVSSDTFKVAAEDIKNHSKLLNDLGGDVLKLRKATDTALTSIDTALNGIDSVSKAVVSATELGTQNREVLVTVDKNMKSMVELHANTATKVGLLSEVVSENDVAVREALQDAMRTERAANVAAATVVVKDLTEQLDGIRAGQKIFALQGNLDQIDSLVRHVIDDINILAADKDKFATVESVDTIRSNHAAQVEASANVSVKLHEQVRQIHERMEKAFTNIRVELDAKHATDEQAVAAIEGLRSSLVELRDMLPTFAHKDELVSSFLERDAALRKEFSSADASMEKLARGLVQDIEATLFRRIDEGSAESERLSGALFDSTMEAIEGLTASLDAAKEQTHARFNSELEQVRLGFETVRGELLSAVETLRNGLKSAVQTSIDGVALVRTESNAAIEAGIVQSAERFNAELGKLHESLEVAKAYVDTVVEGLTNNLSSLAVSSDAKAASARTDALAAVGSLKKEMQEVLLKLGDELVAAQGQFKTGLDGMIETVNGELSKFVDSSYAGNQAIRSEVSAAVDGVKKELANSVGKLGEQLTEVQASFGQKLTAREVSTIEYVKGAIEQVNSTLQANIKDVEDLIVSGNVLGEKHDKIRSEVAKVTKDLADNIAAVNTDIDALRTQNSVELEASSNLMRGEISIEVDGVRKSLGEIRDLVIKTTKEASENIYGDLSRTKSELTGKIATIEGVFTTLEVDLKFYQELVGNLEKVLKDDIIQQSKEMYKPDELAKDVISRITANVDAALQAATDNVQRIARDAAAAEIPKTMEMVKGALITHKNDVLDLVPKEVASQLGEHVREVLEPSLLVRMMAKIQSEVDRLPRPRDGINGKDGEPGVDGINGKDGTNGRDARVVPPSAYEMGKRYKHGDWVHHSMGIWVAARETDDEPVPESSDWDCVVAGIQLFSVELDKDERTVELGFRMTDGTTHEHRLTLPIPVTKDIYDPAREYSPKDIVTFDGSWWEAKKAGMLPRPGNDGSWKLSIKRGKDGIDRKQPPPAIIRYAEGITWQMGKAYEANEVVEHAGVYWLALRSTRERPPFSTLVSNDTWLKMGA